MNRVFIGLGKLCLSGLMVVWLAGCGNSGDVAHNHDHDHGSDENDHGDMTEEAAMGALSEVDLAAQKAAYPLTTCLVGGDELGSMGDPVEYVHEGRLVQFCCESCIDEFKKDSTKFLAQLDDALKTAGEGAETEAEE